jgi:hypothetical protein
MAPLHDVMCGAVYESITPNPAMKIAGQQRGQHIHERHWQVLADQVGMDGTGLKRRVREMASKVPDHIERVAGTITGSAGVMRIVERIGDTVRDCCARMIANLKD